MHENNATQGTAAELQRRALEKFGAQRAEALAADIQQMAQELDALNEYAVGFEDEP